jgi:hypothetical protein
VLFAVFVKLSFKVSLLSTRLELDVLPEEILRQILHCLCPMDVLAASRVCAGADCCHWAHSLPTCALPSQTCHFWNVVAAEPEYWEQHIRREFPAKLPVDCASQDLKKA